jgi:hypothetical protein
MFGTAFTANLQLLDDSPPCTAPAEGVDQTPCRAGQLTIKTPCGQFGDTEPSHPERSK